MGLSNWLSRKKSVSVWAIKQLDDGLIHLCGKGTIEGKGHPADTVEKILAGLLSGPVRMQENGVVLNSGQFAVLIPEQDLTLVNANQAQWQGRHWQVAWVPQRCWLHDGRLTTQQDTIQGRLLSIESTDDIRAKAQETSRQDNRYLTQEAIEPPHHWARPDRDDHNA